MIATLNTIANKLTSMTLAILLGVVELFPFGVAAILVATAHAAFGASRAELALLPDWWLILILMLIDALRDSVKISHAGGRSLMAIAVVTALISALLPASLLLTILISNARQAEMSDLPSWFNMAQAAVLAYGVIVFIAAKIRSKFHDIENNRSIRQTGFSAQKFDAIA